MRRLCQRVFAARLPSLILLTVALLEPLFSERDLFRFSVGEYRPFKEVRYYAVSHLAASKKSTVRTSM